MQCKGTTKAGKRCRNPVAEGSTHCNKHEVVEIKPNATEGLFADGLKLVFDKKSGSMHFDRDDKEIQLSIKNRWNGISIGVTADANTRVRDLVETAVQYCCLPANDDEGKPFPYYLHFCREDVELDNATLVYRNPVQRGDVLRLDLARPDRYHFAISFAGEDRGAQKVSRMHFLRVKCQYSTMATNGTTFGAKIFINISQIFIPKPPIFA